jgi:hypothetical protein
VAGEERGGSGIGRLGRQEKPEGVSLGRWRYSLTKTRREILVSAPGCPFRQVAANVSMGHNRPISRAAFVLCVFRVPVARLENPSPRARSGTPRSAAC